MSQKKIKVLHPYYQIENGTMAALVILEKQLVPLVGPNNIDKLIHMFNVTMSAIKDYNNIAVGESKLHERQ